MGHDLLVFSGNVRFCANCWDKHLKTVQMLSGQGWIEECQICQVPINTLMAQAGSPTIKMAVVAKDGCYQYVCQSCKDAYLAKRKDLFKETEAEGLYA